LNEPDDAALVNQVGDSATAVEFFDHFIIVGYKRKPNAVLGCKVTVRFHTVSADTDDLCIQFFKFFQIPLEGNNFIGSDRRKYGEIERQNDVFFAQKIRRLNFPLGGIPTE